ncbi:osteopetrosis-associated transmembrane protein 1-like isoform X2 [Glandiceps talaboti]
MTLTTAGTTHDDNNATGNISSTFATVTSSSHVNFTSQQPITMSSLTPSKPRCKELLDTFGEVVSQFTKCAVVNSRPFNFCEDCVDEYINVTKYFDTIEKDEEKCGDVLLRRDRVMLIEQMKDFAVNLWSTAHCDGCYPKVDGKVNYTTISNDTVHFQELLNMTTNCFSEYSQEYMPPLPGLSLTTPTTTPSVINASVCTVCLDVYHNLSLYFDSLGTQEEICMDIVDAVNYTQYVWSRQFECKQPVSNPAIIISLSTLFCILPVFFYIASRIHTVKRERKLVKRKSHSSQSMKRS